MPAKIIPFFSKSPCDICKKYKKKIRRRHIHISIKKQGGNRETDIDIHKQSSLCKKCKKDGWEIIIPDDTVYNGKLVYYNWYTYEFKMF